MEKKSYSLWDASVDTGNEQPTLDAYIPQNPVSDCAIVIFPGGGYCYRTPGEGAGYANFLRENGITAFVCNYRISPSHHPAQLMDARRAIQLVRYHAGEFGICKDKIAVMGSSAGGHLAALTATYYEPLEAGNEDELAKEDFVPNAQILCYPITWLDLNEKQEIFHSSIVHFWERSSFFWRSNCPRSFWFRKKRHLALSGIQ